MSGYFDCHDEGRSSLLQSFARIARSKMDRDKLMKMAGAVRTGGKGSVRRCGGCRRLLSRSAPDLTRAWVVNAQKEEGGAQDDVH